MRNRRFLIIGIAIATLFLMITSVASVIAVGSPADKDSVSETVRIERNGKAVHADVKVRRGVYRFNKKDFDTKSMRPIWNGEKPETVPAPAPMKDSKI
ncbi:MAG: hypothetical protein ACYC1U_06130 [Candidatus Aquicultorales bacterium]